MLISRFSSFYWWRLRWWRQARSMPIPTSSWHYFCDAVTNSKLISLHWHAPFWSSLSNTLTVSDTAPYRREMEFRIGANEPKISRYLSAWCVR